MDTYAYQNHIDILFGPIPASESREKTLETRRRTLKTIRYLVERNIAPEFNLILAICYLHGWYVPQDLRTAVGHFEQWPKNYQTDPHYQALQNAIKTTSEGHKDQLIPPASHFYRNPAHLSYQYDIRRLQQISNDNQTKRGRLLNSIEQGYIYEDIIEWTNWGHEIRRPMNNFASIADGGKFAGGYVNAFNSISFIGMTYYLFRMGLYSIAAVEDLWRTRERRKNEGTWQWIKGVFNKNGRIHQLLNDFLWGVGGIAMLLVTGQAGMILVAVALGLDVVHQVVMTTRAVLALNRRIKEVKAFKEDEIARLKTLTEPDEIERAQENIEQATNAIAELKQERVNAILKGSVVSTALVLTMFVGWMVAATFPVAGASIMFGVSVALFAGYFLLPKIVDVIKNYRAKRAKKSELPIGAESDQDIPLQSLPTHDVDDDLEDEYDPDYGDDIPLLPMNKKAKNEPVDEHVRKQTAEPVVRDGYKP